jgi:hypothetical protein
MDDGIRQGFGQRQFDIVFVPDSAFHFADHVHYTADDRVHGIAIASQGYT